nr:hypothetical protein [Herbaspirillum rhizosphaerae]
MPWLLAAKKKKLLHLHQLQQLKLQQQHQQLLLLMQSQLTQLLQLQQLTLSQLTLLLQHQQLTLSQLTQHQQNNQLIIEKADLRVGFFYACAVCAAAALAVRVIALVKLFAAPLLQRPSLPQSPPRLFSRWQSNQNPLPDRRS